MWLLLLRHKNEVKAPELSSSNTKAPAKVVIGWVGIHLPEMEA